MITSAEDEAYFRTRADEEQKAAAEAQSDKARDIHRRLAEGYENAAVGEPPLNRNSDVGLAEDPPREAST